MKNVIKLLIRLDELKTDPDFDDYNKNLIDQCIVVVARNLLADAEKRVREARSTKRRRAKKGASDSASVVRHINPAS